MRILCLAFLAILSTSAFADRERSSDYQQGFRDGFAEGKRAANGGGSSNNNWDNNQQDYRTIRIFQAAYGSNSGSCDFTERLSRTVEGKTSYFFKPGNNWCGDPSNHVAKEARIEYGCGRNSRTKRIVVPEGRSEYLRCD